MANTRKASGRPVGNRPMNAKAFMASLNSPWRGLGRDVTQISQIHYPAPTIDLPEINYQLFAERLKNAQDRTRQRATNDMWRKMYDYESPSRDKSLDGMGVGVVIGLLTDDTISGRQLRRITPEVRAQLTDLLSEQDSLEQSGEQPVRQEEGLMGRVLDVVSRLEYAGANTKMENGVKSVSLFEKWYDFTRGNYSSLNEWMAQNRSESQILYDESKRTITELKAMRDAAEPGSIDYAYAQETLDRVQADRGARLAAQGVTTYHPAVQPDYDKMGDVARPEGEYVNYKDTKTHKSIQRREEKHGLDIVPSIFPTSGDEAKSWWAGLSGKDKVTYTDVALKQGYETNEAVAAGILQAIFLDPSTYATGGMGQIPKLGAKAAKLGRIESAVAKASNIDEVKNLLKLVEPALKGKTLRLAGQTFKVGTDTAEKLDEILMGGTRTGRQMSRGRVAAQQKRIVNDFNLEFDKAIKSSYKELYDDMKAAKKAIKKASDPAVIEAKIASIANRAAGMNLDKAVVDALEDLARRGDLLDVPMPKPKTSVTDVKNLNDEGLDAVMASRTARTSYLSQQAKKFAQATAKPLSRKVAKASAKTRPLIRKAKTVMTYSSLSKVPVGRLIDEVMNLAKDNIPELKKTLQDYEEYLKTYGNDPSKVITVEDVVSNPALLKSPDLPVEVRRLAAIFDVSDVKDLNNPISRMFKDMGYTDAEARYMTEKYRAAMAQSLNRTFTNPGDKIRLAEMPLDWSEARAAKRINAKAMNDVMAQVAKSREAMSTNVKEFLAKTANDFGAQAGTKSAFELRFAGIPVAHVTSPAAVSKAWNTFMQGDNLISTTLRTRSAALKERFRGYSSLSAELNNYRASFLGAGEQIIAAHLGYLHKLWEGIPHAKQVDIMDNWMAGATPEVLEKYGAQLASIDETFMDLQAYLPGIFRVDDISDIKIKDFAEHFNRWLPKDLKLDVSALKYVKHNSKAEWMSPDMWRDYYSRIATKSPKKAKPSANISALDHTWQLRMAMEKEISRMNLVEALEESFGTVITDKTDISAKVLLESEPGKRWVPIVSDYIGFKGDVFFPPEIADEIHDLIKFAFTRSSSEIAYGTAARITTFWKALVTVYNVPEYFIRNALSDSYMMFFAGFNPKYTMTGVNVLADTSHYVKLLRENPEFARAFHMADPLNQQAMRRAMSLSDKTREANESATAITFGRGFKGPNGETISALNSTQMLKYYFEYGLETNFVRTSVGAVREVSSRASRKIGDPIKVANSYGEDARRLSLFADGMAKAEKAGIKNWDEALEFAADHTRKYLFDYSDFSNFERNALGRIIPFYKWTRKAVPLMTEMLFFKPGKISAINKIQTGISTSLGAENPGEQSSPWLASNDAIIPTWMRLNPMMYIGDNGAVGGPEGAYGTYAAFPNPFNEVMSRTIDPLLPGDETIDPTVTPLSPEWAMKYAGGALRSVGAISNPFLRAPIELSTQSQYFGGNELGPRPMDDPIAYALRMIPQINKTQDTAALVTGDEPVNLQSVIDFLGAANIQKNTPDKQLSEILFQLQIARSAASRAEAKYRAESRK